MPNELGQLNPDERVAVNRAALNPEKTNGGGRFGIRKASRAMASIIRSFFPAVIPTPNSAKDKMAVYKKSLWAYSSIYSLAQSAARIEVELLEADGSVVDEHPVLDLLNRPNPHTTRYDLIEASIVYLSTVGECFFELAFPARGGELAEDPEAVEPDLEAEPLEMYYIRPDRMTPRLDKTKKKITGWEFRANGGTGGNPDAVYDLREIIYTKCFDPLDDWRGMGAVEPALDSITADRQAIEWTRNHFEHGGTPPGVLGIADPESAGEMSDPEIEAAVMAVEEKLKQREIPFLDGLTATAVGGQVRDMDFQVLRKFSREEVLSAVGVPPIKVGLLDGATYANAMFQNKEYYEGTVWPILTKIENSWTAFLLPLYKDTEGRRLHFNIEPFLEDDDDTKIKRISEGFIRGAVTPNQFAQAIGIEHDDDPNGDKRFIMKSVIPLDEVIALTPDDEGGEIEDGADFMGGNENGDQDEDEGPMEDEE